MKDQHTKIKGYRDLSQEEIDLMNEIKTMGVSLMDLQGKILDHIQRQKQEAEDMATTAPPGSAEFTEATAEFIRLQNAEPERWAAIAKTDLQTGLMALTRAVAQPGFF